MLITLWVLLRKDFVCGLAFAVFFWVSMTTFLRFEFQGLPAFTIHRLMLMEVAVAWLARNRLAAAAKVPLASCFAFWALANLISLAGTEIDFLSSLKRFLDFVLEVFASFFIISSSLKTRDDALRVLRAAWLGLLVVAALAIIERLTRFNPVDSFIAGYVRDEGTARDVLSTFQHRILLGTAMVMGVPLTFLMWRARNLGTSAFWCAIVLFCSASYFSFSRGPWLALALAFAVMALMGSNRIRSKLMLIGVMTLLALAARPGVVDTLTGLAKDSVNSNSFKGGNVQYRLELWAVAYSQIAQSPWRLLFGCGPGVGAEKSVDWDFSYKTKQFTVQSWDNEWAYNLFQSGFIGLTASLLLYFTVLKRVFSGWRALPPDREVLACLLATVVIPIWMMTNVLIFAKQLDYLFWTVVAASLTIIRCGWVEEPAFDEDQADAPAQPEECLAGSSESATFG